MRLLDTDILIDVLREYQPAVDWFNALTEPPSVPGFVVLELVQGCANTDEARKVNSLVAPLSVVWPTPADCARALTDFPGLHLSHGVGVLDALIGACAAGLEASLCTYNLKHFRAMAGVVTEQPYAERS